MLETPQAMWFGDWTTDPRAAAEDAVSRASAANRDPLLVIYHIPDRDCGGGYSSGGAKNYDDYRSWILDFTAGLGESKAFVILEPDALAQLDCLPSARQDLRLSSLRFAVDALSARSGVTTYVDAGHAAWIPADVMARRLESVGVSKVRGFATNVSYFNTTDDEVVYGRQISDLIDGKHFVIDTSRNGAGAVGGENGWCNPPGRALGVRPLSESPDPRVDALLWIKHPGVSDGECGRGEPPAGTFWPEYALGLAEQAGW